ncbi:MAG: radical SAM family heme chaperone HemW [Bacteroidales bacterium]|nr:radical SAM family heme chaperone HemW [Bacteroidales bacterium]
MIYVHVPFCGSFCSYCDFYSEIGSKRAYDLYADSLCEEIKRRRSEFRRSPSTLYFGGGTPSILPLHIIKRIIGALSDYAPFEELTMEANPEDIRDKGPEYVLGLKSLGVNRMSMGVQSFDDAELRRMNRRHDAAGAMEAFGILRDCGFTNISLDLIFGDSRMSESSWAETLRLAVLLHPEHISCYQLTVEGDNALARMKAEGRYTEASDEVCETQYKMLCKALGDAGYRHYEISNFALPGYEAVHNSAYWSRAPYVGLGPSAHSFDGTRRSWNSKGLGQWTSEEEILSEEDSVVETIMLSLRTAKGCDADFLKKHSIGTALDKSLSEGRLIETNGRIRIPEEYFFISDTIIKDLI